MTEARIRVRIDTGRARSEQREIARLRDRAQDKVNAAAKRAGSSIRSKLGLGIGAVGGGMLLGRLLRSGGRVDMLEEALFAPVAAFEDYIKRTTGSDPAADKAARAATRRALATIVGDTGRMHDARSFFATVQHVRRQEEQGRRVLRRDSRFQGAQLGEVIEATVSGYLERTWANFLTAFEATIVAGFDYVYEGLTR